MICELIENLETQKDKKKRINLILVLNRIECAIKMAESRERIRGPPRDGREGLTSPRQVLRRLMILSDGRQYREAAGVVGRLGPSVFRSIISELPMDILIEALPHSAYLLETFFGRLVNLKNIKV